MTNLHFHGLHVSPDAPGDDILTMMAMPGQSLHYTVDIPADWRARSVAPWICKGDPDVYAQAQMLAKRKAQHEVMEMVRPEARQETLAMAT
jgi:hypothetical protein